VVFAQRLSGKPCWTQSCENLRVQKSRAGGPLGEIPQKSNGRKAQKGVEAAFIGYSLAESHT
jgi:hypothetical protein